MDFPGITGTQQAPMIVAYGVKHDQLDAGWNCAVPLLAKAFTTTVLGECYTLTDIYEALKERRMQLWLFGTDRSSVVAAAISQIVAYPQCKVLDIPIFGGENVEQYFDHFLEVGRVFARDHNCKFIGMYGRLGWARAYRKTGGTPSLWMMIPVGEIDESH